MTSREGILHQLIDTTDTSSSIQDSICISKEIGQLTLGYQNRGTLIIRDSQVLITPKKLILRLKNGNLLFGNLENLSLLNVSNGIMELSYTTIDQRKWYLSQFYNYWGINAIKKAISAKTKNRKNDKKMTEFKGEFIIYLPSFPHTHLKRVFQSRKQIQSKAYKEVGHFTEELFCLLNSKKKNSKILEISKKPKIETNSTRYRFIAARLFILSLMLALYFIIKYKEKWILGVNPDPLGLTDHIVEALDFANRGIKSNKIYRESGQILSSALIDISSMTMIVMW